MNFERRTSIIFITIAFIILQACQKDDIQNNKYKDPYGNDIDLPFDELCQQVAEQDYESLSDIDKAGWTDEVLSVSSPITEKDYLLSNGLTIYEWLLLNDPTYKVGSTKSSNIISPRIENAISTKSGSVNISYPASFYKDLFISRFLSELYFLCNDNNGNANATVKATISKNNQDGLWYRWGGKIWNKLDYPAAGGYANENVRVKFYGLDCSGYLYQSLSNTGFPIIVTNCEGYQNLELWQSWLSCWLKNEEADSITETELMFKKISVSRENLSSSIQLGDIILCKNSQGKTQHVVMGANGGEVLQSCGTTKVTSIEEYSKSKAGYRGPKKTPISGIAKTYVDFDIIRLVVVDTQSSKEKINVLIGDSGRTIFSCNFPQPKDLSLDETFAYDYQINGNECLVYAAGWDSELQNIFFVWFIFDRETYDISSVYYVLATIDEIKKGVSHEFEYKNTRYQICLKI